MDLALLDKIKQKNKNNAHINDCSWPWFFTTLSWNTFDYCCFSGNNGVKGIDKYHEFNSIDDVWNSSEFIKIREFIVKGKTAKICPKDCPHLAMERNQSLWRNDRLLTKAIIDNPDAQHRKQAWDNYEISKEAFLDGLTVLKNKPVIFDINTGSACNFKCKFCYHHSMDYRPDSANILKYIDDCKDTLALGWIMGGEPLLTKVGREILQKFSTGEYKFMAGFVTNGSIFDKGLLEPVPISQVTISTDGATKETYEKIRLGGNFETLIKNIKQYVKLKDEKPYMDIDSNFTITSDNFHEIPDAIRLYEDLGVQMVFHLVMRDKEDKQNILYRKDLHKELLLKLDEGINLTQYDWTKNKLLTVKKTIEKTKFFGG